MLLSRGGACLHAAFFLVSRRGMMTMNESLKAPCPRKQSGRAAAVVLAMFGAGWTGAALGAGPRDGGEMYGEECINCAGVTRYRDGQWKTFFPMHGLADYWVYAFAEQPGGTMWIGTWAGANRLDKAGQFTTYKKELVNEWVYGVAVDAQQRVWFGTEGGISMFDGEHWRSWTHKEGLGADNADNLPISLNTGLGTRSRHDLNVLVDGEPSYNPNYVFCVTVAADNKVWAGTWGGGVSRYDGNKWTSYTTHDGVALRWEKPAQLDAPRRSVRRQRLRGGGDAGRRGVGWHQAGGRPHLPRGTAGRRFCVVLFGFLGVAFFLFVLCGLFVVVFLLGSL